MQLIKLLALLITLCVAHSLNAQKTVLKFDPKDTLNPFYETITYRLACNYALKKQTDSCLFFINLYLSHTSRKEGVEAILSSAEITTNLKDERWIRMRDKMTAELKTFYGPKFNTQLFLQLLKYEGEDQDTRWESLSTAKKFKYPNGFVDTLNLKHLKFVDSLLSHHVELSTSTVEKEGMKAIFLFIQHCQDTTRQGKYLDQINNWLSSGDIPGEDYAIYTDRLRTRRNLPQIYGSQYWTDEKTKQLVLCPIENIADLNSKRKQMGMKSIQYYLLNVEFFERKKFRRESVAGILKGNENLQDFISKEMDR
ncbi:MAG: hypothetical protein JWO06_3956 [Bacteroidota bacterium]|nr:hypothetical protein [Bacteroidota bacterium]